MSLSALPPVNASLNAASAILLLIGYVMIRRRATLAHAAAMVGACASSTLFLVSYLYYHAHHGMTHFQGQGRVRAIYFIILFSHTVLAVLIVPLVIRTLFFVFKGDFHKHKALARITLPIWLYVSVTGVTVYWMLYRVKYPL